MLVDINNSKSLSSKEVAALAEVNNLNAYEFVRPGSYSSVLAKSWEDYYKEKLVDPYDYYNEHFPGRTIFRHIQTHPDMDHMSGLHNFYWDKQVPIVNFWDLNHSKTKDETDFPENSQHAYVDWLVYELLRGGHRPNPYDRNLLLDDVAVMKNHRFATGSFWTDDEIQVLSPSPELVSSSNDAEDWNNMSYVLKFNYGGRSIILGGDAGGAAWDSMLESLTTSQLDCDVLKASHHGRQSGYHEDAVSAMSPSVVICSIGRKPSSDAHQSYKDHGAEVFSTRANGSISATIWHDGEIWIDNMNGERLYDLPPIAN